MINLMYVVLMAMLALNVSSDVLNGFSLVSESLNRTTQNANLVNQGIYATFDQQIPYVARHTVVLAADFGLAGWRIDALWNWRGDRFDAAGQMPDWNTLDLSLRKTFSLCADSALTVFVSAKDLLDCRYELVRDYPMPGRSVLGGIEFKF